MRKIAILLVLFIFTQIIIGCQGQTPGRLAGLLEDIGNSPTVSTTSSTATGQEAKTVSMPAPAVDSAANFYPDAGLPAASSNTEIVLTDKLKMKLYLVEKYKPGLCFGEPAGVMREDIALYLRENAPMAQFVREYYKIDSELEIYLRVQQIEGINLTRGQNGKYLYRLVDGQCCDLATYEGEINIININIFENLLSHNTKKTPC